MIQERKNLVTFGDQLVEAGRQLGRLCVGIDPHPSLLKQWGCDDGIAGLQRFTEICVEAFSGNVALVKPQVAFYEAWGAAGYQILESAISELRQAGTLVLSDAKRGDIGSTMAGYAQAWLAEESSLSSDAVTVSPFLGYGSLSPVLEVAASTNKGVFVLAATSNPEARSLQDRIGEDGLSISQLMVDSVALSNREHKENNHYGNVGVVIGATLAHPPQLERLNGPILLPGVGAQGATPADVARLTQGVQELAFANVSRGILKAGPSTSALSTAISKFVEEFTN
ncbi:orotidine 5'-phosphate decarboxylase [Corynebacterium diphtheriae]|uniref:orotidine-5'-phosphate decarboxylase n=1 Tax=Corynebacterium diphtheriae TaxID=1717 RepID=UPI00092A0DFF|nr:orotidine-5'-phosphate decarboxylase [Corynebacterium diphtheriae]MBG9256902.1 orotidine-5'-phosphate decarboxylase [Corynebacterium diphtheriae bv. mitis]OJH94669.1 orotidine 5'-phosphate decarboxylase [Corynebacterium diphtheriae]CAB0554021.1 orotidine-5'-phosphate decarboxylase [Corynebacterium diphtheriae]CAB0602187.1 orotidine-5'-phosphate decarboxylase [Corynebacterium diphtheriae]CAB0607892.1 orotidine-5'-phosphate decarboxylase [Corynebacterium diphtheriae]